MRLILLSSKGRTEVGEVNFYLMKLLKAGLSSVTIRITLERGQNTLHKFFQRVSDWPPCGLAFDEGKLPSQVKVYW